MFPLRTLTTTTGLELEVVDAGLHNHDAGPDFFNAKILIGGQMWVGNVELHMKSSQWYQHGHDKDAAYDNTILHVVTEADCEVITSSGNTLPQLVMPIPEALLSNYQHLLQEDRYPRCHKIIPSLPRLTLHSWMSALQTERLSRKTEDIVRCLEAYEGSWEDAFFHTLARYYGFGINNEAFEAWAKTFPLKAVDHHRDDLFQIEAIFFGQAGLLDAEASPERHRPQMLADDYFQKLRSEYLFLRHKFSLTPMDAGRWRFLRLRPQNFPHIRLAQLAMLYYNRQAGFSQILDCTDVKALAKTLQTHVSDYWQTHYLFGEESARIEKKMSRASIDILLINAVIPTLFAYGRYRNDDRYQNRALDFLEQLKAEDNNIVRMWRECSFDVENAGDSQALIQLKKEYCDRKECLRCRIGYQWLKRS